MKIISLCKTLPYTFLHLTHDMTRTPIPARNPKGAKVRMVWSIAVATASGKRVHSGHCGLHRRVLSSQKKVSLHVRVQLLSERSLVSRISV